MSRWEFDVELSWRSDKRLAEGELLKLAKEKQVLGVAQLFGPQEVFSRKSSRNSHLSI